MSSHSECWEGYHEISRVHDTFNNVNHLRGSPGGACRWGGSVDVEDLARGFSSGSKVSSARKEPKIQHSRHHRVFRKSFNPPRPSAPSAPPALFNFDNQLCENNADDCYEACQFFDAGLNQSHAYPNVKYIPPQLSVDNSLGIPCTEAQWLACPVTECPAFNNEACTDNSTSWNSLAKQNWNPPCDYPAPSYNNDLKTFDFYLDNYPNFCPLFERFQDQQSFEEYLTSEKRKEKSRDAARCRRSRETDIFVDLAATLPIPQSQAANLDKASVMRLAIGYLKVRRVVDALEKPLIKSKLDSEMNSLIPEALHGFMLVLSNNGDMAYLSENISEYLGVSQMDMLGQSIYEYSHPCDHDDIREYLSLKPEDVNEKRPCNFFLRLKCTLANKGRKVNIKSASYKVIHCIGRPMRTHELTENTQNESESSPSSSGSEDSNDSNEAVRRSLINQASLVVVCCPIPHPSNIEIPLGRHTFLSKHNLTMKFTYVDERLTEFLGWSSSDLVGKSIFEFHHALDCSAIDKSFKILFSKGQCETMAYRFLANTGGYAWVVTQATVIHCSKQSKAVSVVCVNYILSDIECENEVYSERQLGARSAIEKLKQEKRANAKQEELLKEVLVIEQKPEIAPVELEKVPDIEIYLPERTRPLSVTASIFKDRVPDLKKEWLFQNKPVVDYEPVRQRGSWPQSVTRNLFSTAPSSLSPSQDTQLSPTTCRRTPQTATASIFAPRTEDMNKGFLTFSEDQPGLTMLKDEPEDLTHLAPTPGDVCVPLEDSPFLSDMLDEFMLCNENYCSLLSPSMPADLPTTADLTEDPIKGNGNLGESLANDPFFYRDTSSSPTCGVSQSSPLLSTLVEQSPGSQSIDSLGSPGTSSPTLESAVSEDDILMLSMTDVADEELALRAPYIPMSDQDEALQLLISDDTVMWGSTQPLDKRLKWNKEGVSPMRYQESSLAKLLKSDEDLDKNNSYAGNFVDPVQVLGQTCRKGLLERSSKRLLGPASSNAGGESKRMKCNEQMQVSPQAAPGSERLTMDTSRIITVTPNLTGGKQLRVDAEDFLKNTTPGQTLLLQQLMADRDMVTTENHRSQLDKCHQNDTGGGGGGGNPPKKAQSNSVLMNLLVSGCDKIYGEPPLTIEEKLRMPLHITVDSNDLRLLATPCLMSDTIDSISPNPKKLLMDSISTSVANNFNDNSIFSAEMENPLSPGSELLRVLGDIA